MHTKGIMMDGIKKVFQDPDAVMRDMTPAIRNSISEVFPGILQIICHYHFVKDLGKNIFRNYDGLRSAMVATKALKSSYDLIHANLSYGRT